MGAGHPAPGARETLRLSETLVESETLPASPGAPPVTIRCAAPADPEKTLDECAGAGQTLVVELPDQRLLAILPLDSDEEDPLTDELLASNPRFQELMAKSKASPRKPFRAGDEV
jgi:hypothetical protein